MESSRKHRGFIKSKLGLPFYKVAAKTGSSSALQYSMKAAPNQSSKQAATVGYVVHQEYIITQLKPKVSFVIPDEALDSFDKGYGDEAVDLKAANYISSVQERFKLERINSERMNCQDVHPYVGEVDHKNY